MLNTATASEAPSKADTIQDINSACIEISVAARTLGNLADQAIDRLDKDGEDFALSVELLAAEIGRRVLLVQNFLDRHSFNDKEKETAAS
jgi:hypothetical protein